MKTVYAALVAASFAAAHPHQHGHHHHHFQVEKRADADANVDVVTVVAPTTIVYSLNGKIVSDAEVKEGIANGTLIWADGAPEIPKPEQITKKAQKLAATTQTTVSVAPTTAAASPATTAAASDAASQTASTAAAPAPAATSASVSTASSSTTSLDASGVDSDFPDGTLDCSTFPSQYGAVKLDYLGLGGWSGIQNAVTSGGSISSISSSSTCGEGMYCSYACPAGYQKSQWPSTQGAKGQSVGGVQCSGGKLRLTNSALSTKLCIPGVSQVKVVVENQMGQQVAVCRTDYPGSESETIPVNVQPGSTQPLTCPDNSAYYQWQGSGTSAQYYVNPAGYGIEKACQWGDASLPIGNWAPLNLGVGWSNGAAYVSIFPNKPTTDALLEYKVTVTADANGQTCTYSNGAFTSSVGGGSSGCTISASSGTIKYTFSTN